MYRLLPVDRLYRTAKVVQQTPKGRKAVLVPIRSDILSRVFELAGHWKTLLLLDEADFFVDQRAMQDIHRNNVVCTFLRTLEYCHECQDRCSAAEVQRTTAG
jgi:hypothetical protein